MDELPENFFTSDIRRYLPRYAIPLYIESVAEGKHPARRFHRHTFMELVLILAGEGMHLVESSSSPVRAGDVLVIPPGVWHCYDRTETLALVNLVYDPHQLSMPILDGHVIPVFRRLFLPEEQVPEQVTAKPLLHLEPDMKEALAAKILELAADLAGSRPGKAFLGMAMFMEIAATLCRYESPGMRIRAPEFLIGGAIQYMHENYARRITSEELCACVHMSRRNFFRRFRNAAGCTPQEYLAEIRFQHAVELLLHSDLAVTEIALHCGFCDGNYLGKLFRRKLNRTPKEFRASRENGSVSGL
ncbi:MAG: helix-turn-helix domain-containing protein [Lentisphaeria bacterium]|nr:helix-turn-helix domain-containing protein [Lentisphaeria bacterium]